MNPEKITVYEAEGAQLSLFSALKRAIGDIRDSRQLIWRLFVRDFTAQFRQRIFGYFWIVLGPLLSIAGYWFMAATGYLRPGAIGLPYVIFLYVGTSLWGFLLGSMGAINGAILSNGDLLIRTNAPPVAIALSSLAGLVYNIIVNFFVLLLLLAVVQHTPSPWIFLYPLLIAPILIVGIGLGLVLGSIGVIARDVTTMVTAGLGIVMFATPVIYDAKFEHPILAAIVQFNPFTYLVAFPRELTMAGDAHNLSGYLLTTTGGICVLALGLYCFYLIKDRMIERL